MRRLPRPFGALNTWRYHPKRSISQASSSLLYKPLNPSSSEIRLLKLPHDASSEFELVTVSLNDKPKYAALSYLWGDPKNYGEVTINDTTVRIPDNLASAFLCILSDEPFRKQPWIRYLWADAICINQNDLDERSEQVRLMRRIFQLAHTTFAWTGPKDYSLAFKTIKTLSNDVCQYTPGKNVPFKTEFDLERLRHHPELCVGRGPDLPNNHLNDPWSAVADFLQHEYWQRVWIFQEVVIANQLVFTNPGGANLPWAMLRDLPQSIGSITMDVQGGRKPDFLPDTAWSILSNPRSWGKLSWLIQAQARTKIPDPDGFKGWAVSTFAGNLKATDDRDYIYGLLGVSGIPMTPDYSSENTASHVYTRYVASWLKAARNQRTMHVHNPLAFLTLAGIRKTTQSDLPSWVPDYTHNYEVITPWCYKASDFRSITEAIPSTSPEDIDIYPYVVEETQSLFCWGVDMGTITLRTSHQGGSDPAILASFMSLASSFTRRNSWYTSGVPAAQAIIKLLSHNLSKTISQDLVDSAMSLAMLITYFNMTESRTIQKTWSHDWDENILGMAFPATDLTKFGIQSDVIAELSSWDIERRRAAVLDIMPRLYQNVFFETSLGYLGAADYEPAEGDRICLLAGYKEPVVLRPTPNGTYAFVGSALVVDLHVDAELESQQSQTQWFELR
ncbi:heterokaryon incompatibility protein (het-6OR allele) [Fusarium heterosporum]|uniref:Heterokaryon incompatibility protein (Het-6OR allele) n=1 Tax=Fusarium heterosporum TaxID=42747 RepID=A0A8H5SSP0_FUSHE|nr:heterokaryon incompatibility protein (het-6OR allele) [Fusarium heterosporum]